ncbi:MAG TPA: hypothetical protein VN719_03970 [Gemmatimonadales bacterium]|jgi:hypothetical protein|nr:hypothetical protein [Gemmatimonadales bacterium]
MWRSARVGFAALALMSAVAGNLAAQETGTPVFKAPYRAFTSHEFGGNLSFPSGDVNLALEGFYGFGHGAYDLGLRAGFEDLEAGGGTRILLGGDFRTRVLRASESFPLDGAITVGVGLNAGDGPDVLLLPVGLSLGRRFLLEGSKVSFVPYVNPVIAPAISSGDSQIDLAFGLGIDIRFANSVDFRISGGLGDIEGIALGIAVVR